MVKFLAVIILSAACLLAQDAKPDRLSYTLAPNDDIVIQAPQAAKLNGKTFRIQPDGFVNLPSIGRIQAGGLTVESLEKLLAKRMKGKGSVEPKVKISVLAGKATPAK